jgi:ubiquinone/menaquinone biosynthesis C-methylase UbiE
MGDNSIQSAYTQWSATYDTDGNLTRDLDRIVTERALAGRRYHSVVELGCGTGKNTALLAGIADSVQAMDFSEGMLAQARAKGFGPHVTFTQVDLTRPWPCADQSADLIVCNLVLEHIAELPFVFAEASRTLARPGRFFLSELHPFKQYMGSKATFQQGEERVLLPAFVHHISAFLDAAAGAGLALAELKEWWHDEDQGTPPRLVTFMFEK